MPICDLEQLVKNLTADLHFFTNKMNIFVKKYVDWDYVFKLKGSETYFLSNLDEFISLKSKNNLLKRAIDDQIKE